MKGNRIAVPTLAVGREGESVSDERGRFRRKGDLGFDRDFPRRSEAHIAKARRRAIHLEDGRMGKAIAHIRASAREAIAPRSEVEALLLAELHIDASLPDTFAAHAREIRLAADLEREAAVQDVIPHVPLGGARR